MTKLTKAEIQARIEASAQKKPKFEKINNSERLAVSGVRIVHLLPDRLAMAAAAAPEGRMHPSRGTGLTVAYRPSVRSPAVLEIATAICRAGDTFSRKMGTKLAIENFQSGRTVFVPAIPERGPVASIFDMFANEY